MGTQIDVINLLEVEDVTGQKALTVSDISAEGTIQELIDGLLDQMELPRNDVDGVPLSYAARLDREGRLLQDHEKIGQALREGDKVTLQPRINAGCQALRFDDGEG